MGSFHRTNITDEGFIRGAGRLLIANTSVAAPTKIADIIVLTAGGTQYDPQTGWSDLGATKTGIQIARNNAEEEFDVDQIQGAIASQPTNWEMSVGSALAEVTLDRIAYVWESSNPTTDVTPPTGSEKHLVLGQPVSYTQRRLAVLFQRPNGKIRAYFFRKTQRLPQESAFTHQKTGEQATLPMRWRCLADDTVVDVNARFGEIIDQI